MSRYLWWVCLEDGRLAAYGRHRNEKGEIWEGGPPNVCFTRRAANLLCRANEQPVKVRLSFDLSVKQGRPRRNVSDSLSPRGELNIQYPEPSEV